MTEHLQTPASAEHEAVALLLPWHANGTLAPDEQALVERHLSSCAQCRRDAIDQQQILSAMPAPTSDVDAGWAKMQAQMQREAPVPAKAFGQPQSRRLHRPWAAAKTSWRMPAAAFGGAAAALVTVLIVPSMLMPAGRTPANYEVLSSATSQPAAPAIFITVKPDLSEAEFRAALNAAAVEVRRGPTETGAWVLAPIDGDIPRALAALKKHPAVTLAVPLEVDEGR
jgi:hypothetical protein